MRNSITLLMIALMPFAALAVTPTTAVLDVQNMTCSLCQVTIKKSLEHVPGVTQVRVDFENKTATVTFDGGKTSTAALIKATSDAGFPSTEHK